MNKAYLFAQATLIGLFLSITTTNSGLESASASLPSDVTLGSQIALTDPTVTHHAAILTKPVLFDSRDISNQAINNDRLIQLNHPERHSPAALPLLGKTNDLSVGLLSDAGGLMETATAPKYQGDTTSPFAQHNSIQTSESYRDLEQMAAHPSKLTNSTWDQLIAAVTAVPEPSTYLMFAGFLVVAALAKRRKDASVSKTL